MATAVEVPEQREARPCVVCTYEESRWCKWMRDDARINLPNPPSDLRGSVICSDCYRGGAMLEQRARHHCAACGDEWTYGNDVEWLDADSGIRLPKPPTDLEGAPICEDCYRDGETMEQRIRAHLRKATGDTCPCAICGATSRFSWCCADPEIGLPPPPRDLLGTELCASCYKNGATMELRVRKQCGACGTKEEHCFWQHPDSNIDLPDPPDDLKRVPICADCYTDGQTMEKRIRRHLRRVARGTKETGGHIMATKSRKRNGDEKDPEVQNVQITLPEGMTLDNAIEILQDMDAVDDPALLVAVLAAIPAGLPISDALATLRAQAEELETLVDVTRHFTGMNAGEVLVAITRASRQVFGWTSPKAPGFWEEPPQLIEVETGEGKIEQCLLGKFRPRILGSNALLSISFGLNQGQAIVIVSGRVPGKHRQLITKMFDLVTLLCATDSIYKGRAVIGKFIELSEATSYLDYIPRFMPIGNEGEPIFSREVQALLESALWAPIRYSSQCRDAGIPLRRGILLEGPFGTGKTLAAHKTARVAVENGWSFVYCEDAANLPRALAFAKNVQPAVVFAEDLDLLDEEAVNGVMNTIDGIVGKGTEIMVVTTTNYLDELPRGLLRPGRMDAIVHVGTPDANTVERLIRSFGEDVLAPDVDLTPVAERLAGHIPAVVREVVERSKLAALARSAGNSVLIDKDDLLLVASAMVQHVEHLNREEEEERSDVEKAAHVLAEAFTPRDRHENGSGSRPQLPARVPVSS